MRPHAMRTRMHATSFLTAVTILAASSSARAAVRFTDVGPSSDKDHVEWRGVAAGPFDPAAWADPAKLNLLPDARSPLIAPSPGPFRNIYAPSAVEFPAGTWRVFFGGWDGTPTGNDCIYSLRTGDFLAFADRGMVIAHGAFQHVCNVNAMRVGGGVGGEWVLTCTGYPDPHGQNKPVTFRSPDGRTWNGSPSPYPAAATDLVTVDGYRDWPNADVNGMNVALYDAGKYRLYFSDFHDFGRVYLASGADGKHYQFEGPACDAAAAVNDVKKLRVNRHDVYLMGLHMNRGELYCSVSADPQKFPPPRVLARSLGKADAYMVAVGFVTRGDDRVLGFLYGAGAAPSLDANRIFARWLQKRVVFVDDAGQEFPPTAALGPDRQTLELTSERTGHLRLESETGTPLGQSQRITVRPGRAYELTIDPRGQG